MNGIEFHRSGNTRYEIHAKTFHGPPLEYGASLEGANDKVRHPGEAWFFLRLNMNQRANLFGSGSRRGVADSREV
jgi:hypothetical protein